jgi:hypothetical protein
VTVYLHIDGEDRPRSVSMDQAPVKGDFVKYFEATYLVTRREWNLNNGSVAVDLIEVSLARSLGLIGVS